MRLRSRNAVGRAGVDLVRRVDLERRHHFRELGRSDRLLRRHWRRSPSRDHDDHTTRAHAARTHELRRDLRHAAVDLDAFDWRWREIQVELSSRGGAPSATRAANTIRCSASDCVANVSCGRDLHTRQAAEDVAELRGVVVLELVARDEVADTEIATLIKPGHATRVVRSALHDDRRESLRDRGERDDACRGHALIDHDVNGRRPEAEPSDVYGGGSAAYGGEA